MPVKQKIAQFVLRQGRRPRVLISNMGRKSHGEDNQLMASFLAETGFDVDISPLHQTPRGAARMALENDVHVICFLSMDNRHRDYIIDLTRELKAAEVDDVRIVMGGAIPRSDHKFLRGAGVDLILTSVPVNEDQIHQILDLFETFDDGS